MTEKVWFNFCFSMLRFSEGFDSYEVLPYFFSICAIAPLIICFDLIFRKMIRKITISHFCFQNITANIFVVQFPTSNT